MDSVWRDAVGLPPTSLWQSQCCCTGEVFGVPAWIKSEWIATKSPARKSSSTSCGCGSSLAVDGDTSSLDFSVCEGRSGVRVRAGLSKRQPWNKNAHRQLRP